jgi:hypothetical protein
VTLFPPPVIVLAFDMFLSWLHITDGLIAAMCVYAEVERTCVRLRTTGCFWWPAKQQYVGEPLVSFQDDKTKTGAASSAGARGFHLVATEATW